MPVRSEGPMPLSSDESDESKTEEHGYEILPFTRPSRSLAEHVAGGTVPLWLFSMTSVTFTILTFFLLRAVISSPAHSGYDFSGYLCAPRGAPADVAVARGCFWDTFSNYWFHKERYDSDEMQALMREFTAMFWPRFLDKEAQHPIDVLDPSHPWAWVSKKEHYWHCGYALIQTHLWLEQGFDPPGTFSHTKHCVMMLLEVIESHPPPDLMDISANLSIPADPKHWPLIKPYYPCKEEGLRCRSEAWYK